jgi:hypothetical protein
VELVGNKRRLAARAVSTEPALNRTNTQNFSEARPQPMAAVGHMPIRHVPDPDAFPTRRIRRPRCPYSSRLIHGRGAHRINLLYEKTLVELWFDWQGKNRVRPPGAAGRTISTMAVIGLRRPADAIG